MDASAERTNVGAGSGDALPPFSFFATSLKAMQELSGSQSGFGGDLRFGETGPGAGLRGADKICTTIAETSLPGASKKTWRAFLSATAGEDGQPVHAIDRVGEGPWYDRLGRVLANSKQDLLNSRPNSADSAIVNDFPNEDGVPNHRPDPGQPEVDNHDFLTGTNDQGQLHGDSATCKDWTSALGDGNEGRPRVGHSWPRSGFPGAGSGSGGGGAFNPFAAFAADGGTGFAFGNFDASAFGNFDPSAFGDMANWMSALDEAGCGAGVDLVEKGPPNVQNPTVGSGGGYGGIYCFALSP